MQKILASIYLDLCSLELGSQVPPCRSLFVSMFRQEIRKQLEFVSNKTVKASTQY
jgi:hypothetical protein